MKNSLKDVNDLVLFLDFLKKKKKKKKKRKRKEDYQ